VNTLETMPLKHKGNIYTFPPKPVYSDYNNNLSPQSVTYSLLAFTFVLHHIHSVVFLKLTVCAGLQFPLAVSSNVHWVHGLNTLQYKQHYREPRHLGRRNQVEPFTILSEDTRHDAAENITQHPSSTGISI